MQLGLDYRHDNDETDTCKRCGVKDETCGEDGRPLPSSYCRKPVVCNVSLTIEELSVVNKNLHKEIQEIASRTEDLEMEKYRYMVLNDQCSTKGYFLIDLLKSFKSSEPSGREAKDQAL